MSLRHICDRGYVCFSSSVKQCLTRDGPRTAGQWTNRSRTKGKLLHSQSYVSRLLWRERLTVSKTTCCLQQRNFTQNLEELSSEEKAKKFQRPKAQTTIDEEEISKFSELSAIWWDESGEFKALHSLNEVRIPLVRDALVSKKNLDQYKESKPLEGFWILDVGSGGGILSEPLARLGASVIGVEASEESIKVAQAHLIHDPAIRDRVKYIQTTVEEIAETQAGKFDAVIASEVLEHVADPSTFVSAACQLVRPGGSIFFTTLNKTRLAYALGIVAAENVFRILPPGTHDWNKFISPMDLQYMLEKNGFSTRLIHGMFYNPFTNHWSWMKDTSINYAIHAVRAPAEEGQEGNVWTPQDSQMEPPKMS